MTFLFNTMHKNEVKDWYGDMGPEELLQLCYHVISGLDWFMSGMTKASLGYDKYSSGHHSRLPSRHRAVSLLKGYPVFQQGQQRHQEGSHRGPQAEPCIIN
jgi:hypothetical protein